MKMNYEDFKKRTCAELMNYLPEEYQNYEVKLNSILKVNVRREVINLLNSDDETSVSPNIYLDVLYDFYVKNCNFDEAMEEAVKYYIAGMEYAERLDKNIDKFSNKKEDIRSKIIVCVINRHENAEFLSLIPHKNVMDLAVMYRVVVDCENENLSTATVNYGLMKRLGLDEDELYNLAIENTRKIMPFDKIHIDQNMYILTNKKKLFGANCILYNDELSKIANEVGNDLYVLPSSLHELFVISSDMHDIGYLKNVVYDANRKVVRPEDILSDSVYMYSRSNDVVSQVC